VREPEHVTGYCYSLQALRQAANALRNLSTAANSARKALRTLMHGRAHGRAVHHQRAVNHGGLSPPPSSIVDSESEAGEKHAKKFPSRGVQAAAHTGLPACLPVGARDPPSAAELGRRARRVSMSALSVAIAIITGLTSHGAATSLSGDRPQPCLLPPCPMPPAGSTQLTR
jgi:hypothetical protein